PLVFFTDSATPVIYTLSLHDALPIFPVGRDEPDRPHVGDAAVEGRIPRLVGNPGVRPRLEVALRPNPDLQLASAREVGNDEATLDRKSTRLNSSHVKISYAVFCLKKK